LIPPGGRDGQASGRHLDRSEAHLVPTRMFAGIGTARQARPEAAITLLIPGDGVGGNLYPGGLGA
jgi:hypothetical protein